MTAQTQEELLATHLEQQKINVNKPLSLSIISLFSFLLEFGCIEIKISFNTLVEKDDYVEMGN